jgi:acetylornithine deacetylase
MKQLIASLAEKRIPFFQKLIQIPSLRGGERLVQMLVAEELKQLGLDVKLLQQQPAERLSDGSLMGPVTVGVLKGTGGGRSLILNFHVDTAPPGPEELWTRHPFSGTVEDGLIHGRGAVDDKAGCIEVLLVLDLMNECGIRLKGDLIIQSVVEDEYSGKGTELCLKKGYYADAALIVDGHFGTRAALGNAGQLEFMLSLNEKASPERPFRGDQSFVEDVSLLLRKLTLWSNMLDKNTDPQWVTICSPGLNTGKISYKQASEESSAECSIDGLVKFGGPFTAERLMELFRRRIERIAASHRIFKRYDMDLRFGDLRHNPIAVTADTDFFRALSESVSAVMGEPASTQICRGWCDMEYFWRDYSIPCYLYGPGRGRNAHAPDECFELDQFIPHTEVIVDLVKRWCGV